MSIDRPLRQQEVEHVVTLVNRYGGGDVVYVTQSCDATDAMIAELINIQQLSSLDICGQAVTDLSVKSLCNAGRLEWLVLDGTSVSDASIDAIASMSNLKSINLSSTLVTKHGVDKLRRLCPKLEVVYDEYPHRSR